MGNASTTEHSTAASKRFAGGTEMGELILSRPGQETLDVLIAGISPFRLLDDDYQGFFDLVAGQVTTAIANTLAYEEERKRAEALAELDRAKTEFFNNVS